jgi:thiol-disulfide isomerase/thioredoxin
MHKILDANEYLQSPHPEPYSGLLVSDNELKEFIKISADQNKQSIIIFGANWCPDARLLEGVLRLPTVKNFLKSNVNILNIDVGNYEMNTNLFSFFDSEIKEGIPRIFIMDAKGKNINLHKNGVMRKAREFSTQEIFNYFQKFIVQV